MFRFKQLLDAHLDELTELVATENGKVLAEARGDVLKAIEVTECACSTHYLMQGDTCMNVSEGYDTVSYREPLGVFAGDRAVQFPGDDPDGLDDSVRDHDRQHRGPESGLDGAADRHAHAGAADRGWSAEGRGQPGHLLARRGRQPAGQPRRQGRLLRRLDLGRQAHLPDRRRAGKRVQALTEAKNHALVLEDCVLERTVRGIINSTYGCAGQRCMALPVVCVQESIADDFVALLKKFAQELKIGPAYKPESQLGPVTSVGQKELIEKAIARGVEEGAELVLDGRGVKVAGLRGRLLRRPDDLRSRQARHVSWATRKSSAR